MIHGKKRSGFTLIELLIVIAIIAILALIAVPNFLEAQTRAKVARVLGDMRSLSTALASYQVDHSVYPLCVGRGDGLNNMGTGGISMVTPLTTPLAYMSTVDIADPFVSQGRHDEFGWVDRNAGLAYSIHYVNIPFTLEHIIRKDPGIHWARYMLSSQGPDNAKGPDPTGNTPNWWVAHYADPERDPTDSKFRIWSYSPTNGTVSAGDINFWEGAGSYD